MKKNSNSFSVLWYFTDWLSRKSSLKKDDEHAGKCNLDIPNIKYNQLQSLKLLCRIVEYPCWKCKYDTKKIIVNKSNPMIYTKAQGGDVLGKE